MSMLAGLDTGDIGPLRKIEIKHPPTLEWVSHGCVSCGTRHSFAWNAIPYRDTTASVCGRCWGLAEPPIHEIRAEGHVEAVAYADDIDEGTDVPDDYERHYCEVDGEDWPCATVREVGSRDASPH